jgi:hypothetical protein
MVGRRTASAIASASRKSFLFDLTKGFTYWAGISRTACPSAASCRPTWWAPQQASMPTRQGGRAAKRRSSCALDTFCRSTMAPRPSKPIRWKVVLPMSIPTVVTTSLMMPLPVAGPLARPAWAVGVAGVVHAISVWPVIPARRAACSRGRPSSALASASNRALTRPSRSRRASRRSSAGLRSGRIGSGAGMARVPGSPPVDNAPAAQPIRHWFVRAV